MLCIPDSKTPKLLLCTHEREETAMAGRVGNFVFSIAFFLASGIGPVVPPYTDAADYRVVDTGQEACYNTSVEINPPAPGERFFGQDAQFSGWQPDYQDNGDGTVTDRVTGLMWQKNPGEKMSYDDAVAAADTFSLAEYEDWRLPTIKELYSLIVFSGIDPSGWEGTDPSFLIPFIDTDYFGFEYGDVDAGERIIDAQYWSSTEYMGTTMNGDATTFGVNFADGRIKGYPSEPVGPPGNQFLMTSFVKYVRGNAGHGVNSFVDKGNGTITDNATGLMWMKNDSGTGYDWEAALAYSETLGSGGHGDWRLPNAKELQSIIDYTRSPSTSGSAAIDPIFNCSAIVDEGGELNYPFYWTGTTHANWTESPGQWAAYVAFGEALGWMEMPPNSGNFQLVDVHGAGAQRSDPKEGDPDDWPCGHGPQGDVVRIFNHVRCVRGGLAGIDLSGNVSGGELELTWAPCSGASAYWIYGKANQAHFEPGLSPGFSHRLDVCSAETTTWSSPNGVEDPEANWTYLVLAANSADQEIARSNRFAEYDFACDF
jgi:hypothetical protein